MAWILGYELCPIVPCRSCFALSGLGALRDLRRRPLRSLAFAQLCFPVRRPGGGIGRRSGLKIRRAPALTSSSLVLGISLQNNHLGRSIAGRPLYLTSRNCARIVPVLVLSACFQPRRATWSAPGFSTPCMRWPSLYTSVGADGLPVPVKDVRNDALPLLLHR